MKRIYMTIFSIIAAAFVFFMAVFTPMIVTNAVAYAATVNETQFEKTDVLDDLRSMDGFSLMQYPFYESEEPEMAVIDFVEYCYDYRANMRDNYGLYLYVYNPNRQDIITDSAKNKVQIAVAYDSYPVTDESVATDWDKFNLQFCSMSTGSGVNGLFYKFKVIDKEGKDGKTIAERVNSMKRRYDVSGIELQTQGNPNATEYGVGSSYCFTGYAEGYGDGGTGTTLTCATFETIKLDVHSTTYRFPYINENGAGHQNQLDSVYFAVPKEYNENYGDLYRVKCCWDEQKTTPVVVTNNNDVYNMASNWVGQKEGITDLFAIFDGVSSFTSSVGTIVADWGWGYNFHSNQPNCPDGGTIANIVVRDATPAGYVFLSDDINVKDTEISSEKMKEWIYGHDYADYLFSDTVDDGRTKGYQERTFTADEPFDMLTFDSSASGWEKFYLNWQSFWTGTSWDFGEGAETQVEPIRLVSDNDFTGTDETDAQNLYVYTADFDDFEEFYKSNKAENNIFLLRFAVTDYYSNMQTVDTVGFLGVSVLDNESTYMAQETVFLDFDIIELTFKRDSTETIIPVVASPIDVVGSITSPISDDTTPWWQILLFIAVLILLVVILWPILPYIVRAVIWVVLLPVKLIKAIVKAFKKKDKSKNENKKE